MPSDQLGLLTVVALTFLIGCAVAVSRLPQNLKLLLYAALALRVVGAGARYLVLFALYDGSGDAVSYYEYGVAYAERFHALDFSPFWDRTQWKGSNWWGTQFMHFPAGIAASLFGHTMLGHFILFSLLAFAGLVAFVVAFRRAYPHVSATRYARWVWLFPSLWFWPSSIGKEAVTLFGFGLAVLGFVGVAGRIRWIPLAIGLLFVYAIRPQVAAVLVLSFILAHWLGAGERWTVGRTVQGAFILGVGLAAIYYSLDTVGVGSFDVEGVQGYMSGDASRRLGGGSSVEAGAVGLAGIPLALVNVLMRPFPWEASNPMVLVSSLEIFAFWGIAWIRRKQLLNALRHWRSDRFLRVALPLILVYSITLGMMLSNLGIIARQRIFLFPFLFLLLEAVPQPRTTAASEPTRAARRPRASCAGAATGSIPARLPA